MKGTNQSLAGEREGRVFPTASEGFCEVREPVSQCCGPLAIRFFVDLFPFSDDHSERLPKEAGTYHVGQEEVAVATSVGTV